MEIKARSSTREVVDSFGFTDNKGDEIKWVGGQYEIMDPIIHRETIDGRKRVEVIASTQYGKSASVGAALAIRASMYPDRFAIIAGTKEKARIIMEYVIDYSLNNPAIRSQLPPKTALDRLKQRRSQDRLNYAEGGEVRVFSADATRVSETSKSLMGFGSPNVIEDESALIPDVLQATVMRMLGGHKDNFLMKIGNPFNRGHFLKTWKSDRYFKVFIDYHRALQEGRYSKEFIEEMKEEAMFDILYECKFPEEGIIDSKGWLPLLTEKEIERAMVNDDYFVGKVRLGCDVAGGGRNYSTMIMRSDNVAAIAYKKHEPDTMVFGSEVIQRLIKSNIEDGYTFIDKVGIGKGVYDMLNAQRPHIIGVNVGVSAKSNDKYYNLRSELYWKLREWVLAGGKLLEDDDWYQLTNIKWKVKLSGNKSVIIIKSKEEMLKDGVDSPDIADGLMLTFDTPAETSKLLEEMNRITAKNTSTSLGIDPYDAK